jgi:phage shock protein PspC (stress-responsive transcriptional regulator)
MDNEPTADSAPSGPPPFAPTDPVMSDADASAEVDAGTAASDTGTPDTGTPDTGTPDTGNPAQGGPVHRLRRDMGDRMLGGVAAGLARYLDVDVLFVRIAFAALTVIGGSGALIYVAAWLLVPADGEAHPLAQQWATRRPARRSLVVVVIGLVLAVIALGDLFRSGPWWPGPGSDVGLVLGAVALLLAVTLVVGSGGHRTAVSRLRWLLVISVLAVAAVVVVVAATVFSIEAASGVPLRGGIGDTQFHPTTGGQLQRDYRLAIGNLNVDLSGVAFRSGTTHVTATVGIGRLIVEVPPGPTVSVVAHSGLGNVQVFGQNNGGFSTVQSIESGAAGSRTHLVLDADAGVGQVQVVRTEPAYS